MSSSKTEVQSKDFATRVKDDVIDHFRPKAGSPAECRDTNTSVSINPVVVPNSDDETLTLRAKEEQDGEARVRGDLQPTDLSVKRNNNNNHIELQPQGQKVIGSINNNHISIPPSLSIKSSFSITNLLRPLAKDRPLDEPEDLSRARRPTEALPEVTITPQPRLLPEDKAAAKRKAEEIEEDIDVEEEDGEEDDCDGEEEEDSGISETHHQDEARGEELRGFFAFQRIPKGVCVWMCACRCVPTGSACACNVNEPRIAISGGDSKKQSIFQRISESRKRYTNLASRLIPCILAQARTCLGAPYKAPDPLRWKCVCLGRRAARAWTEHP